jgi:hypothetical protein
MRTLAIIFLALAFFALVPLAHAANPDYPALKNAYIQNHPGQTIIPFPWETSTSIKVLPLNYTIPAAPGNNISITACRDQFESGSFIITAQKDVSGIGITVPDLYSSQGNQIPADAIDVRLVKVWYQAGEEGILNNGKQVLTPELLLKDDSLVKVDYVNKINYLKVSINGVQQYIDISNPTGTFPGNAEIYDTSSLQPFSLATNENKQIWLTVHVPDTTPSGDYFGDITITSQAQAPIMMNVKVTVLPFDLEPAPLKYGIYYRGKIPPSPTQGINHEWKTPQQYALELRNMKEHGIAYPTMDQEYDYNGKIQTVLSLRTQSGLPTDRLYMMGGLYPGTSAKQADLDQLVREMKEWKGTLSPYGFQNIYIYGSDEGSDDVLLSERTAWQTVHNNGAKIFVAVSDNENAVNIVGDLLDVAVFAYDLNPAQAAEWHSYGQEIFSYANPEAGVENPENQRKNYGVALWNAGYDGEMIYAYQHGFGHIWNDFDDKGHMEGTSLVKYRDHVFAYPTSNGVIDTIEWEGFREGVDDTRYLATSMKYGLSASSARALITDSVSRGDSMATLRQKLVSQIPLSQTPTPTPTPSPTKTPTPTPTPTNTPTPTQTPTPVPTSSIVVTSPDSGETWKRGTSQTITWNYSGSPGSTVKIVLLKGTTEVETIASSVSIGSGGKGSYTWPMTSSGTTGSDFKVSIQSISQPAINDTSNNYFTISSTISAPSLTVRSPNGGETWKRGTSRTITWSYSGSPGSKVKIVLLKGNSEVSTIASSVSIGSGGTGSYTTLLSRYRTTGTNYRISIQSTSQSTIKDTSDNYFTIS